MTMRNRFCAALLALACIQSGLARAGLSQTVEFNIAPQTLQEALIKYSAQSGVQVTSAAEIIDGKSSAGVTGQLPARSALARLLEGTALTYAVINENTVTIRASDGVVGASAEVRGEEGVRVAQAEPSGGTGGDDHEASGAEKGDDSGVKLEEIVVTAQKREERLQDVPIAISVLTGETLERSTFRGVTEVLNTIPGVAANENYLGGGTNISIRGVTASAPTATGSSPVAYYLDEIPFGLLRNSIGPDASAYDLDRLEVLRGPQGTLYGASALNGVVRVLTHDADVSQFDAKLRGSMSSTSHGDSNYRGDAAVNVPLIEDRLAVRAVVGYQDDEGWIDTLNRKDANDRQMETYRLKIGAKPIDGLTVDLSAWLSRSESGMPSFGYTFDKNRTSLEQPARTDYDVYGATLSYAFPKFTLTSSTGHLEYLNSGDVALDSPDWGYPDTLFIQTLGSRIFSEELTLTSTNEGPWRWSAGAIYRDAKERVHHSYTGLFAGIPVTNAHNFSKSYAAYGELTRILANGALEVTGGLRYFRDKESQLHQSGVNTPFVPAKDTADATTPRFIITWHLAGDLMMYGSYAQGFRSNFPPDLAVLVRYPDFPAVHPDRLHNFEVGSKGQLLNGIVSYDIAAYYIRWEDIQQQITIPDPFNPGFYYPAVINGESASGPGADLSLTVRPLADLSATAYFGWNDLQMGGDILSAGGTTILFAKGDRLNGSPEYTAGASINYDFPMGRAGHEGQFALSGNYTSPQSYRGIGFGGIGRSNHIFVSRAALTLKTPAKWDATVFIDNLTNERGAAADIFVGAEDWKARLRPRTIGLQMEYRYGK